MNIGEICSRIVVVAESSTPVQQAAKRSAWSSGVKRSGDPENHARRITPNVHMHQ